VKQDESISREVLIQALNACGSGERAAHELGVAPEQIHDWIGGGRAPDAVVFAALILIEQKKQT
jgi:hypothetical protein